MKKLLLLSVLFNSCYTKTKEPDHNFMNTVAHQAALDSGLMTTIELTPAKFHFGSVRNSDSLRGAFKIKNSGQRTFHINSIRTGCTCINLQYSKQFVEPGDSLSIEYQMALPEKDGISDNTISVIGNCPSGNKTYYFEATIIH